MSAVLDALALGAGRNAAPVTVGTALLGLAAGAVGTFMVLRKRALVSDAMAHATLTGLVAAFLAMAALGGTGRALPGLMAGAALTAFLALLAVEWLAARTRVPEDAAFEAVGAIIVIAMFTVPPAAARLLTDRLGTQVALSALIAAAAAVLGYVLAGHGPPWLGGDHAVSAAGMIAVVSGLALAAAAESGPRRRSGAPQGT